MRFFSTHSTQQNKTPGRVNYSTRCFVVCPNNIPMKNGVFGLYSNGGPEENRTPVRKPLSTTFSVGSQPLLFPTHRRRLTDCDGSGSTFVLDRLKCERPMQVHRSDDAQLTVAVLCEGTGNPQVTALPLKLPRKHQLGSHCNSIVVVYFLI